MSPVPDKKAEKREVGGLAFLPNFQESWDYTLGTNFVPNVLKKVLSLLMNYRPIKIIS